MKYPPPERFILWVGDGPLEAMDDVAGLIGKKIDEALLMCEEDTCWLNEVIAYMCSLSAVSHTYSGMTARYARVEEWRENVLRLHEKSWEGQRKTEEFAEERAYVASVLNSLFAAVDNCTIPNARKPWTPC